MCIKPSINNIIHQIAESVSEADKKPALSYCALSEKIANIIFKWLFWPIAEQALNEISGHIFLEISGQTTWHTNQNKI